MFMEIQQLLELVFFSGSSKAQLENKAEHMVMQTFLCEIAFN